MKKKEIFTLITDQYLRNIDQITEEYTNIFHQFYRENSFRDKEVEWLFWDLEGKASRYWSYFIDKEKCLFHEEDILLEARKVKENYDKFV